MPCLRHGHPPSGPLWGFRPSRVAHSRIPIMWGFFFMLVGGLEHVLLSILYIYMGYYPSHWLSYFFKMVKTSLNHQPVCNCLTCSCFDGDSLTEKSLETHCWGLRACFRLHQDLYINQESCTKVAPPSYKLLHRPQYLVCYIPKSPRTHHVVWTNTSLHQLG